MPARCSQLWLRKMFLVVTNQVRQAGGAQELEMNAYPEEGCEPSSTPTLPYSWKDRGGPPSGERTDPFLLLSFVGNTLLISSPSILSSLFPLQPHGPLAFAIALQAQICFRDFAFLSGTCFHWISMGLNALLPPVLWSAFTSQRDLP